MARAYPFTAAAPDLPPVTDDHRQRAFVILAMRCTYAQAMADDTKRRVIEACAASLRTEDWKREHQQVRVAVPRCKPGVDGHPVKWATQIAMGGWEPVAQLDLL